MNTENKNTVESSLETHAENLPVDWEGFIKTHPMVLDIVENSRNVDKTRSAILRNDELEVHSGGTGVNYHDIPKRASLPGYLGSGFEKAAYEYEEYVVKVLNLHDRGGFVTPAQDQIDALLKGVDIEGLEQIVTANPELGVVVTQLAPGRPVGEISTKELLKKIRPDHMAKLKQSLAILSERNLEADNISNVLFDDDAGFTVIDYRKPFPGLTMDNDNFLDDLMAKEKGEDSNGYDLNGDKNRYYKRTLGRKALGIVMKKRLGKT